MSMNCWPLLPILPVLLLLLLLSISRGCLGDNSDQKTCVNKDTCPPEDCLSTVLIFNGIPAELREENIGEQEVRFKTLQDDDNEDEPVPFPKLSRFAPNFPLVIPESYFHIAANGDHEGWFIRLPSEQCWTVAKQLVAREIVALSTGSKKHQVDLRGPHRLVDEEGKSYPNDSQSHRLHLLLPREAFVHEAVEEGFVRMLSGGIQLTTLSMKPRVFLVDPILSQDQCDFLITSGTSFQRSGEHHYSPGYENYRTSLSAHTPRTSIARLLWERVHNITAMPLGGVEFPQLLKYETTSSWYKGHYDYFHSFQHRPLEDAVEFVKVRGQELNWRRLGVTDELLHVLNQLDWNKVHDETLKMTICAQMAIELDLENPSDLDERHLIHDYILDADDPIQAFDLVAIYYAAHLLRQHGSSDSMKLAQRYFSLEEIPHDEIQDYVPYVLKPVQYNRHVTVLPILRAAEEGGYTAFPYSTSKLGLEPLEQEEIDVCQQGLLLQPLTGQAVMFYNRLPNGELDRDSYHAGCPCLSGEKYAANCFNWDSDQKFAWRFQMDLDELYG